MAAPKLSRNYAVRRDARLGMSRVEIAEKYGITISRVQAIIAHAPDVPPLRADEVEASCLRVLEGAAEDLRTQGLEEARARVLRCIARLKAQPFVPIQCQRNTV